MEELQSLYDRNLFQQAYALSSNYWNLSTRIENLSAEELVLGLRLAARLGGLRLSRWLARSARARFGNKPMVQYYTSHLSRSQHIFDEFRALESEPELAGADAETQSSWLAYSALRWATIRDFERAHECIERARAWRARDSWVLSCESDVLGMEDRWEDALKVAEDAWELGKGTPYAARSLASSLLNLRRVDEAANRMVAAAETSESYELPHLASWYLCAQAETLSGDERKRLVHRAGEIAERMPALAPLADRETLTMFARTRLDIAEMMDDHEAMARWAKEVHSPFHRKVLENLGKNPTGKRIRLPFRHSVQKHNECLPTSIGSAMQAMGTPIDADAMASDITFGGTPEWAAGDWLEERGFVVRHFCVTPEVAVKLIQNGFAFVLTLEGDSNAHAVAAVGLDEAAGTLLIHDPQGFRATEYLVENLGEDEAPLGPRAMVAAQPERAILLDQILPMDDAEALTARASQLRAAQTRGPAAARAVVDALAARLPSHAMTRMMRALEMHHDGRVGEALKEFQKLLQEFPRSAFVRSNLLACCRSLGNTAMMRDVLANVVERGIVPGIEAKQEWQYPPSSYSVEYADLLRTSSQTRKEALSLLHKLLRRYIAAGPAWHVTGDLLWNENDKEGALLGYRIGAYLQDQNEHYARAYCDALGQHGREAEGLAWLEKRVRRFGSSLHGVPTWITWIHSLEEWGHPERALAAAQEALACHGDSAELLASLAALFARMGQWSEAESLLSRLEKTGNSELFNEASLSFYRMRGELTKAIEHGEAWVQEAPLWMRARYQFIDVLARRDGDVAAIDRARAWMKEYPGHDEMEQLYCQQLDRKGFTSWQKYSILLRRTRRNTQDGWAWREIAFSAIYSFERAGARLQRRLEPGILHFLAECDRTSAGEAVTLRAHAEWTEARGAWAEAVELWLQALEREPSNTYSYNRVWDCSARLNAEERRAAWSRMEAALLRQQGRSSVARETLSKAAERFGVDVAEEAVTRWKEMRPDDPEVVEAHVDLLLQHGHGQTDYQRALKMLVAELERFPFQPGLRLSHADALRKLRRFSEAEKVLEEILRRHPDNSSAQIQLAWVTHQHGQTDEALRRLEDAAVRDPQNASLFRTQVEILVEARRFQEAQRLIREVSQRLPKNVGWRENAIRLFTQCGNVEDAVRTAREGIVHHPRGSYLWFLLGRTLFNQRRFSAHGEIEACFRKSLALNQGLFQPADYLSMLLVEQRCYAEAEEVVLSAGKRSGDDSPARARVAWIHRKQGQKEARAEMITVVQHAPWSNWGWLVVMEWLIEDKEWGTARELLRNVVPEMRTNTELRYRRLEVLEKAQSAANVLDEEWNSLLHDFPEDISLHVLRYDSLAASDRHAEAAEILEIARAFQPDSPYVLGRYVEVLAKQGKKEESIAALMSLFFAHMEPSTWPPDYAWQAIKKAGYAGDAYEKAASLLDQGQRPTRRALFLLAARAMEHGADKKKGTQPFWRAWFPGRGAKAILKMLRNVDAQVISPGSNRSILLTQLSDFGYTRLVVNYWKGHRTEIDVDVESWSEVARALTALRRRREARKFLADWQQRSGVDMWVVANYVVANSGLIKRRLKEIQTSCRDALAGLPHDHCARFLAFMEAESCALLGNRKGFIECWARNKEYLEGGLAQGEWFDTRRRYLLADLPAMERDLRNNKSWSYWWKLCRLRFSRISLSAEIPMGRWTRKIKLRHWWWAIWLAILLLRLMNEK